MSLKNRKPQERQVRLADGDHIAVRGLSLSHLSEIVLAHREDALTLFTKFVNKTDEMTVVQMASAVESMFISVPNIVAHVIACGTGDSSAFTEASELPASDQILLAKEIGELTFMTNGGMGNVLEIVVKLLQNVNGSLAKSGPKTA